jgi:hypothetical protein
MYSNYKGQASTSVFIFYIIETIPDVGCSVLPEHVVVNVMDKYIIIYSVVLIGESIQ